MAEVERFENKHLILNIVTAGRTRSNMTIARELLADQGGRALFSGLTPRLLKVAPACAIMISSYEFCKEFFSKQHQ